MEDDFERLRKKKIVLKDLIENYNNTEKIMTKRIQELEKIKNRYDDDIEFSLIREEYEKRRKCNEEKELSIKEISKNIDQLEKKLQSHEKLLFLKKQYNDERDLEIELLKKKLSSLNIQQKNQKNVLKLKQENCKRLTDFLENLQSNKSKSDNLIEKIGGAVAENIKQNESLINMKSDLMNKKQEFSDLSIIDDEVNKSMITLEESFRLFTPDPSF